MKFSSFTLTNRLTEGLFTELKKLKQPMLAVNRAKVIEKDEVLVGYLNEAADRGVSYGIEEAHQAFDSNPADEAGRAEATNMAAIPTAPTYYSPYGKNLQPPES